MNVGDYVFRAMLYNSKHTIQNRSEYLKLIVTLLGWRLMLAPNSSPPHLAPYIPMAIPMSYR